MEIALKIAEKVNNGQDKIVCASPTLKELLPKSVYLFVVEIISEEDLTVCVKRDIKIIVEANANLSIMIVEMIKY